MKHHWIKTLLGITLMSQLLACDYVTDSQNKAKTLTAEIAPEALHQHETMPYKKGRKIITLSDPSMPFTMEGRVHFIDAENNRYLGMLNTGYWYGGVVLPKTRNEIISPESYFSRGTRGTRTDVVTFYDPKTLQPTGEVEIPNKRMTPVKPQGTTALSDDEKFLLIVNLTPATSISVVDLDERKFVGEIATPGCTHVYPAGNRNFNVICGDGSFMGLSLDEQGNLKQQIRREPLFEAKDDPVTNAAIRVGNTWYHLSRNSNVHAFTHQGQNLSAAPSWSLLTDSQRDDNWRIAGHQHLAIHEESRRLYALMIQGEPEMFEDPATEVWVFDLDSHERVQVMELEHEALSLSIDQGSNPQLYIVGVDLQIPFIVAAWLYLTEGMDKIYRMATFSFDTYDIASGQLKHSMPKVGNFPNLVQPWQ
jgi:Methylamine dehydrogenase heavy chain (MADH).